MVLEGGFHKRTAGVADYFAVIGTGDQLVWKHKQKQGHFGEEMIASEEDENDDETLSEQRFAREITNVRIVVVEDDDDDKLHGHSRVPSEISASSLALQASASYQTESSHDLSSSKVLQQLPASPSHSEATTAAVDHLHTTSPPPSQHPTMNGFTVVQKTLPCGRGGNVILSNPEEEFPINKMGPPLWNKFQTWDANLDWSTGLRGELLAAQQVAQTADQKTPLKGLRRKMETTLRQWNKKRHKTNVIKFYLAFQRRKQQQPSEDNRPAIADVQLFHVRLHRSSLPKSNDSSVNQSTASHQGPHLPGLAGHILERYQSQARHPEPEEEEEDVKLVTVEEYLSLPDGFEEWSIPEDYKFIRDPQARLVSPRSESARAGGGGPRTVLFAHDDSETVLSGESGVGVEAIETTSDASVIDPELLLPRLMLNGVPDTDDDNFYYVPVIAIRRQRLGDEERYHEDAAIVEFAITFEDGLGEPVFPDDSLDDDDEEEDENTFRLLGKTAWSRAPATHQKAGRLPVRRLRQQFGSPVILVKRNLPFGFADAAFATRVLDRFPRRNYKGLPLPEEELPMFCYPTGCRLHRARFSDAPLPQYYGFVVKNERGDSIYVSCVSFMEPLTTEKVNQLARMSETRKRTSLPHRRFCERRGRRETRNRNTNMKCVDDAGSDVSTEADSNFLLTGFDDMTTFENKTICLVGRYPYWTAFRKFLSHLHIMSGSSSELPLERYISHLLLSVPIPRPGGENTLVPLPAVNDPMVLWMPPEKDFPLVDIPYQRLVACLEIKTVVMIVLGMLALERKVIVMSTRPSLVLDICELLRSLIFPFELCAPYVPRLTEPFKSSLDFPGAIFVGIHDDGTPTGLAATVKKDLPEDSIIVDLDTGEIDSDGDRYEVVTSTWDIIPESARSALVSELQTLCRDAGIDDGQEPLDSQFDSAFAVSLPEAVSDFEVSSHTREPLDDRAVRDSFLRFFCAVLGGYERYLVVPDADFLVSGNEWFDTQGFLESVPPEKAPYLNALVSTQLFQSFIQRRTEASDIHCMLFDECLAEYHSSPMPYGRLGGDVEVVPSPDNGQPQMLYSLLVDQSAPVTSSYDQSIIAPNRSMDASEAESSVNLSKASASFADNTIKYSEIAVNTSGDFVTAPSRQELPEGKRYIYCKDGNSCFPHNMRAELFLPKEPESWLVEMSKAPNPLLARSERELEEAERRRRKATSYRGMQNQRRCLWQLPKLMGSHFLGSWLLCIPVQVSQAHLSNDQQSRYLLHALGAIRLLRSRQRIVPDEAAYRALMVACGRTRSDRRVELVKLFGLLRSDGIFPSAATLGQYTRALAEGYSKRSSGIPQEEDYGGVEVTESASRIGRSSVVSVTQRGAVDFKTTLHALDGNLVNLEMHGRRWRGRHYADRAASTNDVAGKAIEQKKKRSNKSWLPVVFSSSFVPSTMEDTDTEEPKSFRLVAIWSRTRGCSNCAYIPLEEEIQAGWDVVGGDNEIPGAVACPRCGSLIVPMLGIKEMSIEEALLKDHSYSGLESSNTSDDVSADFDRLPPQIRPTIGTDQGNEKVSFVTYISPIALRLSLEQYVEEYGEEVLIRDRLRELDPEVFYNFWWYCARFSVPLPLPVAEHDGVKPTDCCAFAAWDQVVAERGCFSASKVLLPFLDADDSLLDGTLSSSFDSSQVDPYEEFPLLSRFNLQGFYSSVWDHPDLNKILVTLVEACDKRDFKPAIETALQSNQRRREELGSRDNDAGSDVHTAVDFAVGSDAGSIAPSVELDVYRVILYLARYQCTSAFHAFFPATIKPCKGYHFWCAIGTPLPVFDRLLRDGVQRINNSKDSTIVAPVPDVSEVALGFRCVFGHLV